AARAGVLRGVRVGGDALLYVRASRAARWLLVRPRDVRAPGAAAPGARAARGQAARRVVAVGGRARRARPSAVLDPDAGRARVRAGRLWAALRPLDRLPRQPRLLLGDVPGHATGAAGGRRGHAGPSLPPARLHARPVPHARAGYRR